jgi:hypothetical protein
MPIPNKRVAVLGAKKAQQQFKLYAEERRQAERQAKTGDVSMVELEREAERIAREARDG